MSDLRTIGCQADGDHVRTVATARRLQRLYRARSGMLGEALFSDPAWDILLDLFVCHHEGRSLSVSAVCIGASASSATGLRYLSILQEQGLVTRSRDQTDRRRSYVHITPRGCGLLNGLLAPLDVA